MQNTKNLRQSSGLVTCIDPSWCSYTVYGFDDWIEVNSNDVQTLSLTSFGIPIRVHIDSPCSAFLIDFFAKQKGPLFLSPMSLEDPYDIVYVQEANFPFVFGNQYPFCRIQHTYELRFFVCPDDANFRFGTWEIYYQSLDSMDVVVETATTFVRFSM
jgi:hypothetical protein